jgi:hypothetical protein
MKNRVRGDNRENPRRSINEKVMPFAQMEQAHDGVDIATRDQHTSYRRGPESFTRVQSSRRLNLQA